MNTANNNNTDMSSTNLETETERVISALSTIYSISSSSITTTNRDAANQYLTQYQRSPLAWQISDRLLSPNSTTTATSDVMVQTQIYFFAAQTIHTKCRSDMVQLPPSSWNDLRDSLLNHLIRFCNSSASGGTVVGNVHIGGSYLKPITSRLAMALCALSVQMQWYDVVNQLILGIQNTGENSSSAGGGRYTIPEKQDQLGLILEMAQLLPEEAASYRLLIRDRNVRQGFIQMLVEHSEKVFDFYHAIVLRQLQPQNNGPDGAAGNASSSTSSFAKSLKVKEQVLKCIHAWVRYIHIPPKLLQDTPLLDWVFSILHSYDVNQTNDDNGGEMFELAVDVVIEILRCYPSDSQYNVGLVHKMIPLVMTLAQTNDNATSHTTPGAKSPFQKALENEDEDGMRAYCRIFTEMGESYMSLIMHHEDLNQVALVELVLNCSALPDHGTFVIVSEMKKVFFVFYLVNEYVCSMLLHTAVDMFYDFALIILHYNKHLTYHIYLNFFVMNTKIRNRHHHTTLLVPIRIMAGGCRTL